jgi:hypothetical protein
VYNDKISIMTEILFSVRLVTFHRSISSAVTVCLPIHQLWALQSPIKFGTFKHFKLGCLHPKACIRSGSGVSV